MNLFHSTTGALTDRINWKHVQFRKIVSTHAHIRKAYEVVVNGVVVGMIGLVRNSISKVRNWVWLKPEETFNQYHFDQHTYSKKWAAASMLVELRRAGVYA